MKLHNILLLEDTPRRVFLRFQQRLIDVDDSFEQANPPYTIEKAVLSNADLQVGDSRVGYSYEIVKMRFEIEAPSTKHSVRTIIFTANFDYGHDVGDYTLSCFGKATIGKSVGKRIFRKYVGSIDEAVIYLDRILNPR